jgi:hypothetical protein
MSIYSGVIGARLGEANRPAALGTIVLPRRKHVLARVTVVTGGCLALLILTMMGLSRAQPVPSNQLLPLLLLSGHLPVTANCEPRLFHHADCRVVVDGKDVALSLDTQTGMILAIVASGNQYRLGDLILAWDTPTGITYYHYGCRIDVFWDTRAAVLYTCALEAGSRVAYIVYAPDPHPLSAWRGFTTTHDCSC